MPKQTIRLVYSAAVEGFLLAKQAEGRSPCTIADYSVNLRKLGAWLESDGRADPDIATLTEDDLTRFFAFLHTQTQFSAKTTKNTHTALGSFYTWVGQEFGLPDLLAHIKSPKANPPAIKVPSREELELVLKCCDETRLAKVPGRPPYRMKRPTALRDRTAIVMLLDTGLRASELCALNCGDVDLSDGSVKVKHGKGDKARIVYLGKVSRRYLWRYIVTTRGKTPPKDDPLFLARGRRMTRDALTNVVHDLGQRAGVELWPHLLRHTFATSFLRNGGTTLALRRLLGHVSDSLLSRYVAYAEADLKRSHADNSPADRWRL